MICDKLKIDIISTTMIHIVRIEYTCNACTRARALAAPVGGHDRCSSAFHCRLYSIRENIPTMI